MGSAAGSRRARGIQSHAPEVREHYEREGSSDPVLIEFPFRGYLPVIQWNAARVPNGKSVRLKPERQRSKKRRDMPPESRRDKAFQFKGKNADVRQIGRKLGAGALVEGSILGQGDRMRVIVQLNRTADGTHLWTGQYDRDTKDILGVEREIALAVAGALRVRLDRNALRLEPRYAWPHARLASVHLSLAGKTGPGQKADLKKARAEEGFRRALALGSSATAHQTFGWALMTRGRFTESEQQLREAIQLDPLNCNAHLNLSSLFRMEGRLAAARRELAPCLAQNPDWLAGLTQLAYLEIFDNHPVEALAGLQRAARLLPGAPILDADLLQPIS